MEGGGSGDLPPSTSATSSGAPQHIVQSGGPTTVAGTVSNAGGEAVMASAPSSSASSLAVTDSERGAYELTIAGLKAQLASTSAHSQEMASQYEGVIAVRLRHR